MSHSLDKNIKIALVHENLTISAGAEQVLLALHELFPDAPIYTPLYKPENYPQLKDATVITSRLNRWSFWRNHHQMAVPLLPYHFEQFDLSDFDIVISSSASSAKGVLTRPETTHICYCHTPMRWAWMPNLDKRASSSWIRRLAAHYMRIWDVATVPRVDVWIANSKTTATRIKKFYSRPARVIYPPVAVGEHRTPQESENYYLSVCRLVQQKRVDIIVQAAKETGFPLKVVGSGPELAMLKKLAGKTKNIQFLGYVSEEEKNELYARCKAFIFASEEDLGIVPIEAMSWGKPVLAYGRGGASETVIDGTTGLHFATQTAESIIHAVRQLEDKTFDESAIITHSQTFSHARFRQEIMDCVTTVMKGRAKT